MIQHKIIDFFDYLRVIEANSDLGKGLVLFRGQGVNRPLLPTIARNNPSIDTTPVEKQMLEDLRRRCQLLVKTKFKDDWEWLVYAQHFSMKTRLLDWSSNPLIALWFACSGTNKFEHDSSVYILNIDPNLLVDYSKDSSPFDLSETKVIRPALNNERIVAQTGWFTVHRFSKNDGRFVELQENSEVKDDIIEVKIPASIKCEVLKKLSILGVNHQTVFPGVEGVCRHLNWKYT